MSVFDIFKKRSTKQTPSSGMYSSPLYSLYSSLNDSNPTVIFCENLISNAISSLPLNLYFRKNTGRTKAYSHPAYRTCLSKPNVNEPPAVFYSSLVKHMIRHGNAYIFKLYDGADISQLILLDPSKVTVEMNGFVKQYLVNGQTYTNKEVIHIPSLYGYDGVKSKSVLSYARNVITSSNNMTDFLSTYYDNNINTRVKVSLNDSAYKELSNSQIAEIADFYSHAGSKYNSGRPLIEHHGIKVDPFNLPANGNEELSANREFNERAICQFFNVPYALLQNQNSYNGFEQFNLFFKNTCLIQYTDRIEEYFAFGLLNEYEQERYYFEFDYNELLRPDTKTRMDILDTQLKNGILSLNEAREQINLDNLDDDIAGNAHLIAGLGPARGDVIEAYAASAKLKQLEVNKQDNKAK